MSRLRRQGRRARLSQARAAPESSCATESKGRRHTRYLRISLRLIALAAATTVAYLMVLLLWCRARVFSVRTDGRPAVCRPWARGVARTVGVRIRAEGPGPVAPRVVVANHLSDLDVVVMGAAL